MGAGLGGWPSPWTCDPPGRSIEYWFRCMDLDGDGALSMFELEYFYEEQCRRLDSMAIEALPFEDCLCQMLDLVKPQTEGAVRGRALGRGAPGKRGPKGEGDTQGVEMPWGIGLPPEWGAQGDGAQPGGVPQGSGAPCGGGHPRGGGQPGGMPWGTGVLLWRGTPQGVGSPGVWVAPGVGSPRGGVCPTSGG